MERFTQACRKLTDLRGRREKQKQLYLYVPSQEKLRILGELVGTPSGFFRYAEGAYIGDLIDEVRITVKKRDEDGGKVSFTQLSEGELQMLTVLGCNNIGDTFTCESWHEDEVRTSSFLRPAQSCIKPGVRPRRALRPPCYRSAYHSAAAACPECTSRASLPHTLRLSRPGKLL
jgi:hypothetical protein